MLREVNDEAAFLLRRRDYRNSSLILELWTRQYGRVSVIARGGKKRRDVAPVQIGYRLAVNWSGQGELKNLGSVDSQPLWIHQDLYPAVFYLNELILYLLQKEDPYPQLFDWYQMTLVEISVLDNKDESKSLSLERLLRQFEVSLLRDLGLMPDLTQESITHKPLQPDQFYQLIPGQGVQSVDENNTVVNAGLDGQTLSAISQLDFSDVSVLKTAKGIMRQLIDFNLNGRTLQSRQFYHSLKTRQTQRNKNEP